MAQATPCKLLSKIKSKQQHKKYPLKITEEMGKGARRKTPSGAEGEQVEMDPVRRGRTPPGQANTKKKKNVHPIEGTHTP